LNGRETTRIYPVLRVGDGNREHRALELIAEQPLLIRVDDEPYSVVMRTPGEEVSHAAGFCLGEGIIDSADDLDAVEYSETQNHNVVDVHLKPERRRKIPDVIRRRSFVSQTSCGICGKRMIADIYQAVTPVGDGLELDRERILDCIAAFSNMQQHYRTSRGSHAALLLDVQLEAIAIAEDVGRHIALDKAIGMALMSGRLSSAAIVVLSSRISHELVQKAARARLQLMISHSRPTTLAVEMAAALNMTLVFPDGESELVIVCGAQRITSATQPAPATRGGAGQAHSGSVRSSSSRMRREGTSPIFSKKPMRSS
jgi:FdhD protein